MDFPILFFNKPRPSAGRIKLVDDEPDVVLGAAKHCVHGIAHYSFKPVAPQLAVVLHVPNRGFDGVGAFNHRLEATRDAPSLT